MLTEGKCYNRKRSLDFSSSAGFLGEYSGLVNIIFTVFQMRNCHRPGLNDPWQELFSSSWFLNGWVKPDIRILTGSIFF